jgi:hypothetical protein
MWAVAQRMLDQSTREKVVPMADAREMMHYIPPDQLLVECGGASSFSFTPECIPDFQRLGLGQVHQQKQYAKWEKEQEKQRLAQVRFSLSFWRPRAPLSLRAPKAAAARVFDPEGFASSPAPRSRPQEERLRRQQAQAPQQQQQQPQGYGGYPPQQQQQQYQQGPPPAGPPQWGGPRQQGPPGPPQQQQQQQQWQRPGGAAPAPPAGGSPPWGAAPPAGGPSAPQFGQQPAAPPAGQQWGSAPPAGGPAGPAPGGGFGAPPAAGGGGGGAAARPAWPSQDYDGSA